MVPPLVTVTEEGGLFAAAAGNCTGLVVDVVELKTAPLSSWSVSVGYPSTKQLPGACLVRVTLATIVPAAPSPSLYTPLNSRPWHVVADTKDDVVVDPATCRVVVVVVAVVVR
jgi:hypothetical protein